MLPDDDDDNNNTTTTARLVTIGSSFFWKNASVVQVQGLPATITVQFAPPDESTVQAWQFAGAAFYLVSYIVYALWALGPTTLSVGRYLQRILYGRNNNGEWPVDWGLTLAAILLVPVASASIVIGWLGGTAAGQLGNAAPVVNGIDFTLLGAAATSLVGVQLVVLFVTYVGWERADAPACVHDCRARSRRRVRRWFMAHTLGIRVAWVRHLAIVTGSLGTAFMATFPVAFFGGQMGSTIMVLFLTPTGIMLVYHQTYYSMALVAMAVGSAHSHAATVAVAIVQVVAGAFFDVVFTLLYLRPVLVAGVPLFGEGTMLAAAATTVGVVMQCALLALLWEMILVLRRASSSSSKPGTEKKRT